MNRKVLIVIGAAVLLLVTWWAWRDASKPSGEPSPAVTSASGPGASSGQDSSRRSASGASTGLDRQGTGSGATAPEGATPPVAEPMRAEEGTLRVEVVTPSGPRTGARVSLYLRGPREPTTGLPAWRLAGSGVTDEAGLLVLPARAGRYLVSARAEGFATARADVTRPHGESTTSVRLTLDAGAILEGSTVERATRNPVPLAELTLIPRPSLLDARASAPQEERHSAASDARGNFRFEGLAKGEYQLEARAPGHAPKRLARVRVPSSGVTVELEGSAFLEGFVELPDGKPAAQAQVSAFGTDEAVVSDTSAGGAFSLDVPPGAYQLTARQGDKTGSAPGRIVVGAGMTVRDIRIRLGSATSIAGVVRRKDTGAPIPDAAISVSSSGAPGDLAGATSDVAGHFEVGGLSSASYDVTVRARGFKPLRRGGITVLEGQRFELVAELVANGRIEGTVVDSAKKPVNGVQITPQRRWGPLEGATSVVTDAAGSFALEDLPSGDIYVAARPPNSDENTRVPVKVEPGQTARVQIQLSDEGTLEGTVRLTGGKVPTRPVTVYARRVEAQHPDRIELPATAEGTFSMRVRAGRYQLMAWLADAPFMNDQEKTVTLEAGKVQRVELEVREARRPITVTVLEPNGAPSVGAVVMGSEAGKSNILIEDLTDESGRVTVVADPIGSDMLHLWATNGGRSGDLPRVPATSGSATLQLTPGARLSGSVRSAGGRAVNGFQLVVAAVRTDEDYIPQQSFEFTGDRFVVEDIAPGRVSITATLSDGRAGKVEATAPSGTATQVDIVVDAGGSVTGRLLDAKTGEPISQAFVELNGLMSPTTGPDGRFRMNDIAPGTHRLTAWERQHDIAEKQVTIASGKEVDLGDWRLGPPRVEPGRLGLGFGMSGDDVTISWIATGAEVGDLQVGDVVTAIDSATVLTPGEARQRELGAPGSQATLAIRRDGQARTLTLMRAK
ncbi:carboxypeptidase regulatory-like domain-containing protein [Hyalangium gracile]|uniref:carboxypeptidase regulatory-like domain-containing protein n=1 Tax=Hyalangium gracile TaxID=394092 RepID=UPI001CCF3456|nr:carboxypeptidase regulatory-like domain-containing protein [Hyalangium gracile]